MTVGKEVPSPFFIEVPFFLGSTAEGILSTADLVFDGDFDLGPSFYFLAL
jgi:hypothetical protein